MGIGLRAMICRPGLIAEPRANGTMVRNLVLFLHDLTHVILIVCFETRSMMYVFLYIHKSSILTLLPTLITLQVSRTYYGR